ncbi:MAG: histidine kinase [Devosia sp.]|nr:histidine kinase [Devosia sp.]
MPTLIRLIISLLFLAGLVYAGMIALVSFVEPTPKQVTIRIPAAELLNGGQRALPGTETTPDAAPVVPPAEPATP